MVWDAETCKTVRALEEKGPTTKILTMIGTSSAGLQGDLTPMTAEVAGTMPVVDSNAADRAALAEEAVLVDISNNKCVEMMIMIRLILLICHEATALLSNFPSNPKDSSLSSNSLNRPLFNSYNNREP